MTKEEWKKVEDALAGLFGSVEMQVDGHRIKFVKTQVGKTRLEIMTYVDGWYRGEWKEADPEYRYLRQVTRNLFPPKIRKGYLKLGRKFLKEHNIDVDIKFNYATPLWNNFVLIRRHYEKNFTSIELVEINEVAVEKDGQILTNTMPAIG